ncbi:endonuclease/exonuclease/phosphatase family protein [Streptomyces iconiensis]|uniref:Endonuclease/exonuclease/phosphatase family protein n=1 Tax=Streptomyces iconiensis TaxID=1384038 RepID=A0ABT7A1R2_9ACTN|nr:endonuclease/exonuclease/phosphatase family protein [Streptomyces iconiensis]MDJ1135272.1 endonuclease/exonuclease/phosphatase family protein [Streptomyces iconiensis]
MRVVTWNLWWRFGPWRERRHAVLAVLRELRPDAVGLQEVWASPDENLAGWLAHELGLHWTWAASPAPGRFRRRAGPEDAAVDVGNAILSRWPLTDRAVIRLPAPERKPDDGRLALGATLQRPGAPVPFFTTHLTSDAAASATRCAQTAALARFTADRTAACGSHHPPVLTGDYNSLPDSDEMRLLSGLRTAPAVPGQVLYDVWEFADPAEPSATWGPANPYVPSGPAARVDYIHTGPPAPDGLGDVRAVRRAGFGPVDGVWPSDHAAVAADLGDGEEREDGQREGDGGAPKHRAPGRHGPDRHRTERQGPD